MCVIFGILSTGLVLPACLAGVLRGAGFHSWRGASSSVGPRVGRGVFLLSTSGWLLGCFRRAWFFGRAWRVLAGCGVPLLARCAFVGGAAGGPGERFGCFCLACGMLSAGSVLLACLAGYLRGAGFRSWGGSPSLVGPRVAKGRFVGCFRMTFGMLSTDLVLPARLAGFLRTLDAVRLRWWSHR